MSTRFKLDIIHSGIMNEDIITMATNHVDGKGKATLGTFKGYVEAKCLLLPTLLQNSNYIQNEGYSITVIENGKPTITIEEIAVFELEELREEHALQIYEGQEGEIINQ